MWHSAMSQYIYKQCHLWHHCYMWHSAMSQYTYKPCHLWPHCYMWHSAMSQYTYKHNMKTFGIKTNSAIGKIESIDRWGQMTLSYQVTHSTAMWWMDTIARRTKLLTENTRNNAESLWWMCLYTNVYKTKTVSSTNKTDHHDITEIKTK